MDNTIKSAITESRLGLHIALVSSVIFVLSVYVFNRRRRLPPGPTYIPWIGVLPGVIGEIDGSSPARMSNKYNSNVICYNVCGMRIVVITSMKLIRDTVARRTDIQDRCDVNQFSIVEPNHKGILFTSGKLWQESRRVTLQRMRDLGMGRRGAQDFIITEAELLETEFLKHNGKPFNPIRLLNMAVANVICRFIYGKRFEYSDQKFQKCTENINNFVRVAISPKFFILKTRIGRMIMRKTFKDVKYWWNSIVAFIDREIEEHELNYDGEVHDLIDAFLLEREKGSQLFDARQVSFVVVDMFGAGSDTTMVMLQWLLLYMAEHQGVQARVYQELRKFSEQDALSINNKAKTPYTMAVIHEVMRNRILFDQGTPITNRVKDFEIDGYLIPKGTPITADYRGAHFDPDTFKNPDNFDPQNFLDEDGNIINMDKIGMFGVGRRSCAGEPLARAEIYLFFVMFVRKFQIEAPEGITLDLEPCKGSGPNQPNDFMVRMIPRES